METTPCNQVLSKRKGTMVSRSKAHAMQPAAVECSFECSLSDQPPGKNPQRILSEVRKNQTNKPGRNLRLTQLVSETCSGRDTQLPKRSHCFVPQAFADQCGAGAFTTLPGGFQRARPVVELRVKVVPPRIPQDLTEPNLQKSSWCSDRVRAQIRVCRHRAEREIRGSPFPGISSRAGPTCCNIWSTTS